MEQISASVRQKLLLRWGWGGGGVRRWVEWLIGSKVKQCIEHLKNHQITFQPFADNCIDADLFPGDNFLYISVLKSQQRLVVALSIIYWGGNEGGEWT